MNLRHPGFALFALSRDDDPGRCFFFHLSPLALLASVREAASQGTAFTCQGGFERRRWRSPQNGSYDFGFALYSDPRSASQVSGTETKSAVAVSNGLFTTTLDFSGAPWSGQSLWLQILVRTNGNGPFSSLSPRQPVTSSPYAIQSLNAASASTAANVTGAIADLQLSANIPLLNGTNSFTGTNGFGGVIVATNAGNVIYGSFTGNLTGNALTANSFTGPLSGDVSGSQGTTTVASVGGQSAASVVTGAIAANAATSTNMPGTIVMRDASGNFAAGAISAGFLSGDGSALTNLNPASLAAGTAAISISGNAATAASASNVTGSIADFQLSTNVAFLDGTNSFVGTNEFAGVTLATNTNNVIYGTFTGNLTGNATTASTAGLATNAVTATGFSGPLSGDVTGTQGATIVATPSAYQSARKRSPAAHNR